MRNEVINTAIRYCNQLFQFYADSWVIMSETYCPLPRLYSPTILSLLSCGNLYQILNLCYKDNDKIITIIRTKVYNYTTKYYILFLLLQRGENRLRLRLETNLTNLRVKMLQCRTGNQTRLRYRYRLLSAAGRSRFLVSWNPFRKYYYSQYSIFLL